MLYAKLSKYEFSVAGEEDVVCEAIKVCEFCGHVLASGGIVVNPSKVNAVLFMLEVENVN
ncbi:hypothetical protein A2U01_0063838, partial [Trifolium medium]|nr:hypothetical protein [Trifolium medium]